MRVQTERDGGQLARDERVLRRLNVAHGDVGLAPKQIVDAVRQHQLHNEFGVPLTQRREDRWQMLHAEHFAGGEPDRAAHLAAGARRNSHQRGSRGGKRFSMRLQLQREIGRVQAARRA